MSLLQFVTFLLCETVSLENRELRQDTNPLYIKGKLNHETLHQFVCSMKPFLSCRKHSFLPTKVSNKLPFISKPQFQLQYQLQKPNIFTADDILKHIQNPAICLNDFYIYLTPSKSSLLRFQDILIYFFHPEIKINHQRLDKHFSKYVKGEGVEQYYIAPKSSLMLCDCLCVLFSKLEFIKISSISGFKLRWPLNHLQKTN